MAAILTRLQCVKIRLDATISIDYRLIDIQGSLDHAIISSYL